MQSEAIINRFMALAGFGKGRCDRRNSDGKRAATGFMIKISGFAEDYEP